MTGQPVRTDTMHRRSAAISRSQQILLVDDDEAYLRGAAKILQNAGLGVTVASDYRRALEILDSKEPLDLLLTDIVLPGVNGVALARMARMRRLKIKLLYLTGYDINTGEASGKILRKPISGEQLVTEVMEALAANP